MTGTPPIEGDGASATPALRPIRPAIRRVGSRSHFLYEPSTRDGLRRLEFSSLTGQVAPDGSPRDAVDAARDEVGRILATHHPAALEPARLRELERIVATADDELRRTAAPAGTR
jgi:trimethylamine:corrinoid methyltransferase-like protein